MRILLSAVWLIIPLCLHAQEKEVYYLHYGRSKNDTVIYRREITYDSHRKLYHVMDFYPDGRQQMDGRYSKFDKTVKEEWSCNYATNRKEGRYRQWWPNGLPEFEGTFRSGRVNGTDRCWYENGQLEAQEGRRNGRLNGRVRYWSPAGELQEDLRYRNGQNLHPRVVTYPYLANLPKGYDTDTLKKWPVIIYLHGGSQRGTDIKRLYDSGIPDQIYRGRDFPFLILSPLCPLHLRWTTDDWFDNFFREVTQKYRIDSTRIYLTGLSLGGEGTWYIAEKYPDLFAAIAPISGFTTVNGYIHLHADRLKDLPVWAFHGKLDNVVPFEETESMVDLLRSLGGKVRFTVEPEVGHWVHWIVYPGYELYNWFLIHKKEK